MLNIFINCVFSSSFNVFNRNRASVDLIKTAADFPADFSGWSSDAVLLRALVVLVGLVGLVVLVSEASVVDVVSNVASS